MTPPRDRDRRRPAGTRPARPGTPRPRRSVPRAHTAAAPPPTRRQTARRIRLLAMLSVLGLGAMALRAGYLGIIEHGDLSAAAADQRFRTVQLPAVRGTLMDRTGLRFAVDTPTGRVEVVPRLMTDQLATARKLAPLLKTDATAMAASFASHPDWMLLARGVKKDVAASIRGLHLPGVDVYDTSTRNNPLGGVAAQVVGLVNQDGKGQSGLELQMETTLRGTAGSREEIRDPAGRTLRIVSNDEARPGASVQLTIDASIQSNTERILSEAVKKYGAKRASAVIMNPRDGSILAMATVPRFNPNNRRTYDDQRARNRPVTDVFEPGSTFKVVTIAGALEDGVVSPATQFYVPSVLHVADLDLHDAHDSGGQTFSVSQILQRSSNIGTVSIAQKVGKERLSYWIDRFGFGHSTGIAFPGEATGIVPAADKWSGTSIANIPIGQGISVTQLQLARIYAAIANGGHLVTPHLVQRIREKSVEVPQGPRIMTTRTSRQLDAMLRGVVSPDGTGSLADIPGYIVAGKTGTANKVDETTKKYSETRYLASFVGYAPADDPQLVIAVAVDEPTTSIYGGDTAAPMFEDIGKFCLHRLGIAPR